MNLFQFFANELDRSQRQLKDPGYQRMLRQMLLGLGSVFCAIIGAVFISLAARETKTESSGHLWWRSETVKAVSGQERAAYLIAGIVLILVAIVLAVVLVRLTARKGALKQYEAILTGVETIKVERVSEITGLSVSRVYRDIRVLIHSGVLQDLFIDYQRGEVVSRKYLPKASYKSVVKCTACGGSNEVIAGIPSPCAFCGQPLIDPAR